MTAAMETFLLGASFVFGSAIGSFLNVVIHRLPREEEGLRINWPRRSFCPSCNAGIAWYDNLPLISYLLLAGRCRGCSQPIALRYFLTELLTGLMFAVVVNGFVLTPAQPEWARGGVVLALVAAMIAVTMIDIEHRIIPDKIDIPGALLAPLVAFAVPDLLPFQQDMAWLLSSVGLSVSELNPRLAAAASSAVGVGFGWVLVWSVRALGTLAFRKEAMGFGDVKYMAMIGGYVGWQGVLLTMGVAIMLGAALGVVVKLLSTDPYLPFGPFLSVGAVATLIWRSELLWIALEWYPTWIATVVRG